MIYYYNINANRRAIETASASSFKRAMDNIDALLTRIDKIVTQSFYPQQFYQQTQEGYNLSPHLLANELSSLKAGLEEIEPLGFCTGESTIYTIDGALSYRAFEQEKMMNYQLRQARFYTRLQSIRTDTLCYVDGHNESDGFVVYMKPLWFEMDERERFVIAFFIPAQIILQDIREYIGNFAGDLYIYDKINNIIFEIHTSEGEQFPIEQAYRMKGIGVIQLPGNRIAIREKTESLGLTCMLTVEEKLFYANANSLSAVMLVLTVMLFVCCLLLAITMSQFNYKPVHSLVTYILGDEWVTSRHDEFELIRDTYNQTVVEKQTLMTQMNEQRQIIRNQLCIRLVYGQVTNQAELNHWAQCTGFSIGQRFCAVLYILLPEELSKNDFLSSEILQADNILAGEPLREAGICAIVMYNAEEDSSPEDTLRRIANGVYRSLMEEFDLSVNELQIGIGEWKESLYLLDDSYIKAIAALRNADPNQEAGIFFYDRQAIHPESYDSSILISLFSESIKRGESATAIHALDELVSKLQGYPVPLLALKYSEILSALAKCTKQANAPLDLQHLSTLLLNTSFETYIDCIKDKVNTICDHIAASLNRDDVQIKSKLISYIQDHCFEADFSLSSLMDAVHLSKTKINTILQEDVGMSFASYISYLRLNRFRDQLLHTDKSIQSIVQEIGYYDVSSFLRKFKAEEGMTAGEYRKKWKQTDPSLESVQTRAVTGYTGNST